MALLNAMSEHHTWQLQGMPGSSAQFRPSLPIPKMLQFNNPFVPTGVGYIPRPPPKKAPTPGLSIKQPGQPAPPATLVAAPQCGFTAADDSDDSGQFSSAPPMQQHQPPSEHHTEDDRADVAADAAAQAAVVADQAAAKAAVVAEKAAAKAAAAAAKAAAKAAKAVAKAKGSERQ